MSLLERVLSLPKWGEVYLPVPVDSPAFWLLPNGSILASNYHEDVEGAFNDEEWRELEEMSIEPHQYFMLKTGSIRSPAGENNRYEVDCLAPKPTPAQKMYIATMCREEGCWWDVTRGGAHFESAADQFTADPIWDALRRCRV